LPVSRPVAGDRLFRFADALMDDDSDSTFDRLMREFAEAPDSMPYADFWGNERYELIRQLGRGRFGVVHEALDRVRDDRVALKVLREPDADWLYRFKREFRLLINIHHPNLVRLYELENDFHSWFLTMELIDGVPILQHIHGSETRLRSCIGQLAQGLAALHEAGVLHRDVKPSNVLVDGYGRVALLDFGLCIDVRHSDSTATAGTPHYMPPEAYKDGPLDEASDCYAVGVILYQALTGRLPFQSKKELVVIKHQDPPPPPSSWRQGVPGDLDALCMALLAIDPHQRASTTDIINCVAEKAPIRSLPGESHEAPDSVRQLIEDDEPVLVGRADVLNSLHDALERTRPAKPLILLIHSASGVGKTALLDRFEHELEQMHSDVLCLRSTCHESESVPYKVFDGAIDSLSRYLRSQPSHDLDALMPHDVGALAQLFPVLRQVPTVQRSRTRIDDNSTRMSRACTALRELFGALGIRRKLVVIIDDLQWGDSESATVLAELLRPPDPPGLVIVASYQTDEDASSPLLSRIKAMRGSAIEVRELVLDPLKSQPARELARRWLKLVDDCSDLANLIADQAGGNPRLIRELVRWHREQDETPPVLDALLTGRISELDPAERKLLQTIAVAGRPLAETLLRRAAEVDEGASLALARLRAKHLIRARTGHNELHWECYHDRIRDVAVLGVGVIGLHDIQNRLATISKTGTT